MTLATLVAFAVTASLGYPVRWAGFRLRAMDHPGELKPHQRPTPYLGGVAFAGGIAAGLAVRGWPLPWVVTAALVVSFGLGLLDDATWVRPGARLVLELGLGILLAAGGLAPTALPTALAWIAAAVLVAATVNAVNMLDGMDALAAGAAALSAGGLALVSAHAGHAGPETIALVTAGAAVGFLVHNLPPARLFLGDNGAYLLATALAATVLAEGKTAPRLLGAGTCLGVFALDLLLAVLRRASGRTKLMLGDRSHVYDQLQARGLSRVATLGTVWAVHIALIAAGVRAARLTTGASLATAGAVWVIAVAWLLWAGFVRAEVPR